MSKDPRRAPRDWQEAGRGRPLEDRSGLGTHLLTTDPPEHTRLRRLVSSAFTQRRVGALRERVQEVADRLIDGIEARGDAELIADFAFPLPITALGILLGVPMTRQDDFRQWSADVVSSDPGADDGRPAALRNLGDYLNELIATKRRAPRDDLISALIAASDDEGALTEIELLSMLFLLLIAGHESTMNFIGNGALALLRHPDQLSMLRARPELLESAVEEILRYEGPVKTATWRFPTESIQVGDAVIDAGEPVLIALADADRDPARFTDPDRFDITRTDNPHLAFGHGIHYCLGAAFARMEGAIALKTLFQRLPDLALAADDEQLRWRHSLTMRGLHRLPVTFTRRTA